MVPFFTRSDRYVCCGHVLPGSRRDRRSWRPARGRTPKRGDGASVSIDTAHDASGSACARGRGANHAGERHDGSRARRADRRRDARRKHRERASDVHHRRADRGTRLVDAQEVAVGRTARVRHDVSRHRDRVGSRPRARRVDVDVPHARAAYDRDRVGVPVRRPDGRRRSADRASASITTSRAMRRSGGAAVTSTCSRASPCSADGIGSATTSCTSGRSRTGRPTTR